MSELRVVTDLAECRDVWERAFPRENLSDLWEVRDCFQEHFQRPAHFLVGDESGEFTAFLPLSWIEESQCYGYFPGETWSGKTWLEQNRVVARDADSLTRLLAHCPSSYHVRYLCPLDPAAGNGHPVDEIGYLFHPPQYEYDIERYFEEFSHKTAKRLRKELAEIEAPGVEYRYDEFNDFNRMVELNMGRFGEKSYFHDARFRESFRALAALLRERGWLRLTAVLIGGEVAAVDMGCLRDGAYTLLGGGTHGGYPGVAKLINIHHMRRACEERMQSVDFLCGDFSWKKLFHLAPRPLYLLSNVAVQT